MLSAKRACDGVDGGDGICKEIKKYIVNINSINGGVSGYDCDGDDGGGGSGYACDGDAGCYQ